VKSQIAVIPKHPGISEHKNNTQQEHMSNEPQKLPLREKICYGFGDLASCLFWQTITFYLLFFYTDVFGITAKTAACMFFVSRVSDAIFDVVMGMTADRTRTRWGRFRPYLLWMAVPLAVAAVMAFTTPSFGGTARIVYAYATFIVFMFLYSAINIPYTALLGVISGDPVERADAATSKFISAYVAGIIVTATALPLVSHFGKVAEVAQRMQGQSESVVKAAVTAANQKGWSMTMLAFGVVAVVFFLITFFATQERIQPVAKEKTAVKDDLNDIVRNVPWILLFLVTILFILFVCIRLNVTVHYFKYYIGEQVVPWLSKFNNFWINAVINPVRSMFGAQVIERLPMDHKFGFEVLASIFNSIGQVLSVVGTALVPICARYLGRKRAAIILFIVALICTGSFYFFKPEDIGLILGFQMLGSIAGGPISALLWILYADTADYSEWKTGRRATGLVFSASIMSNKLGWAVGGSVAAMILGWLGFKANEVANLQVQLGLKAMMSVIPVAVGVLALILLFFYKLDEPTMAKIKAELEERRKSSGQAVSAA